MTDTPELELLPDDDNGNSDAELPTQQWAPDDDPLPDEEAPVKNFEDLTLAQAFGLLLRMPQRTLDSFISIATTPKEARPTNIAVVESQTAPVRTMSVSDVMRVGALRPISVRDMSVELIQFVLYVAAFLLAWLGTNTMIGGGAMRSEGIELARSLPFVILGFFAWIAGEIVGKPPRWLLGFLGREAEVVIEDSPESTDKESTLPLPKQRNPASLMEDQFENRFDYSFVQTLPVRAFGAILGLLCSVTALTGNLQNHFTFVGVSAWFGSILLWVIAIAPTSWHQAFTSGAWMRNLTQRVRGFRLRGNWVLIALLLIVAVGAYFRLDRLAEVPPEMTSDHVEKILDSARVLRGETQVFFPNNGGREPTQMYLMAGLSQFPGLGMNFTTLKLLTALEGILTLPILFWFGREIVGRDNRSLGNMVGLCLAGLVAVSGWHEVLSRMGLRIVLTVLYTALLLIYLSRALRDNRRGDFIIAGLILGFGLYAYQAVRMLPVVVVVGVILALIAAKSWRARGEYLINLSALVLVAFVVFVPLFGFSLESPNDFWRRTAGRLLGDDVIETTDANGNIIQVQVPLEERVAAFQRNLPVLIDNVRNALLMFNWKGDVGWISNVPNNPEMDALTGALFIVGLAAWLVRMFRRRDPVDWLMPMALFIMLLPSALSIAYTVENPSATRTSGTIPPAYLFAALPLAVLALSGKKLLPDKLARLVMVVVPVLTIWFAYNTNSFNFFQHYNNSYVISSLPYSEVGRVLRGFAESDGSYGNAFMIGYAYWWDHRAIGIEAGRTDWQNGIDTTIMSIPDFIREGYECRTNDYELNPDRDLLFFVAPADTGTQELLQTWFPTGYGSFYETYQFGDNYYLYRVPRLGVNALQEFIDTYSTGPRC
jgi:hypothetical protein